jgi:hypothetical protein
MDQLQKLYVEAGEFARENKQVVGEKRMYYITLQQLEYFIGRQMEEVEPTPTPNQ